MRRWLGFAGACALVGAASPGLAWAQRSQPRSRDYLFVTSVDDARAAWVNPAGLGWVPEASIMGEVGLDRSGGSLRLDQYTLGLNSRGLGVAYQRDRSRDTMSVGVFRIALGLPMGSGAIGGAVSNYRGTREQGFDLGFRYPVLRGLDLGLVVRDIGRPQVVIGEESRPIATVGGATWNLAPNVANLSAEAIAVERLGPTSGFDLLYRGGFVLRARRPWPLTLHAAAEVASDGSLRQWSVGLIVGGLDRVGLMAGAMPTTGLGEVERFSALGIASRRPPGLGPP